MLRRITRVIGSIINQVVELFENPEVLLQNNIREMRNQIPKLNEGVVKAQATVTLLRQELEQNEADEKITMYKMKIAAKSDDDEYGTELALQLQRLKTSREKNKAALESAEKGLESMREIREAQTSKIRSEIDKIKDIIGAARVAALKADIASTFNSYSVGDVSYSNEDMLNKIKQKTAEDESKFSDISDSYDLKVMKIEKQAEEAQAKEVYEQFKKDLKGKK